MNTVDARYTPQELDSMKGNIMIEALFPVPTDEQIFSNLLRLPDFDVAQRSLPRANRLQLIEALSDFMIPQGRHLELVRRIDTTIRYGYIGRQPQRHSHVRSIQALYEAQKAGGTFSQAYAAKPTTNSAALLGISGMGKTVTVRRWFAQYPPAIKHESYAHPQIPYLHVDMSTAGDSVKALAANVIRQIHMILPEYNYEGTYLENKRVSTEMLLQAAGSLLSIHYVGILVVDEVQNLVRLTAKSSRGQAAPSAQGAEKIMAELTTLCNITNVPILFIGTPQAALVLDTNFRIARRSIGLGLSEWSRMPFYDDPTTRESEWIDFVRELATYQWVKTPLELDEDTLLSIYDYTQGIVALAIKLFSNAQMRAILNETEAVTPALLAHVYETDFKLLRPMLEALKYGDQKSLDRFGDVSDMASQIRHLTTPFGPHRIAPRTPRQPRQANDKARNAAAKPATKKDTQDSGNPARVPRYSSAHRAAATAKIPVMEEFLRRGLIRDVEQLVPLT